MSASGVQVRLRPLAGYEPGVAQAVPEPAIPEQQRPAGQLSLPLWTQSKQALPDAGIDHAKLTGLLTALVEVYGGSRNIRQLRTALHPDLYRQLADRPRGERGYRLKSMHARTPDEGVIETCGLVLSDGRALAMCARFDQQEHGWLCTEFTVMEPRGARRRG